MVANLQLLINFPLIIYVGMDIEPPSPYEIKSKYLEWSIKTWKLISTYKQRNKRHMDAQLCAMDGPN